RERYWIWGPEQQTSMADLSGLIVSSWLHPLLHRNTSDLNEQRFSSRLSGGEPYLEDHRIGGKRIFPAACYLEMARAAVRWAAGLRNDDECSLALENVVFSQPLFVEGEREIHIGLYPTESGKIEFEVRSVTGVQGTADQQT